MSLAKADFHFMCFHLLILVENLHPHNPSTPGQLFCVNMMTSSCQSSFQQHFITWHLLPNRLLRNGLIDAFHCIALSSNPSISNFSTWMTQLWWYLLIMSSISMMSLQQGINFVSVLCCIIKPELILLSFSVCSLIWCKLEVSMYPPDFCNFVSHSTTRLLRTWT